eukprot:SAG11_NODE_2468_length_3322_cov_1.578964_1_plen_126_part_00
MSAAIVHQTCAAQGRPVLDLDKGYAPRTTNPLAVIRKRPALLCVPGEPKYTAEEVSLHNRPGDLWVTYKDGVYDVSNFAQVSNSDTRMAVRDYVSRLAEKPTALLFSADPPGRQQVFAGRGWWSS